MIRPCCPTFDLHRAHDCYGCVEVRHAMKLSLLSALLAVIIVLVGCGETATPGEASAYLRVEGQTMGTYYKVTYRDAEGRHFQPGIDSLLAAINEEVSTYIPGATISQFNQASGDWALPGDAPHFVANFLAARRIYDWTEGAFDPTVMPLVNFWGFGYTPKRPVTRVDSVRVDSLRQLVGFSAVLGLEHPEARVLRKPHPEVQLDFSAIAKGYGVDMIGYWLKSRGVDDILVDIGGEARAWGRSPRGDAWRLGINVPDELASLEEVYTTVTLSDLAMATSGNYRNVYESGGVRYSHTIDPRTGYPERNTLLSATVVAATCMEADALATACMVLGKEGAIALLQHLPDVQGLLIFSTPEGGMSSWTTPGMASMLLTNSSTTQ